MNKSILIRCIYYMHLCLPQLDSVQHPSWQAQISGKKTWTLVPVPECEDICHPMNITMEKGDISECNA